MSDILIIDDDLGEFKPGVQQALRGHGLHFALSGAEGLEALEKHPGISLVLLDIKMPPAFAPDEAREGLEVLKRIKAAYPAVPVIMLTVLTEIDLVVEAVQEGAFHYITKPPDRDKLREAVARALENQTLKQRVKEMNRARDALLTVHSGRTKARDNFHGIIGRHPLMRALYHQIERAAKFEDMNVVILGESGAGKDLAAEAIHACSPRRNAPFVAINCAALAETVLEAELFGHEKGAFTGADESRRGLFQQADGGTLFLDEIGEMSPALQAKLLRAIEKKEVTPVGGTLQKVDVRIVCATNRDLAAAKDTGAFREDLFYRIWDIPLTLPPLRERKEDIPALVKHFLKDCNEKNHLSCEMEPGAMSAFVEHDWPGNVRELASATRRMVVFADGGRISEEQARACVGLPAGTMPEGGGSPNVPDTPSEEAMTDAAEVETGYPEVTDLGEYRRIHGEIALKTLLERALREAGNARGAMALLGMPDDRYDAFRKWLQRLGLKVRDLQ